MNAGITIKKRLLPPVWNAHLLKDGRPLYAVTRLPEAWQVDVGTGLRPGIGTLIFEGGGFGATEIFELEQAGFIRRVGVRRGLEFEITDKEYRQQLEDAWDREHPELLPPHRRLQLDPEVFGRLTAGAPIFQVMPRRGVQGLGPGRLFTPAYLDADPGKAAETVRFLFADGAVQEVGEVGQDGRPRIREQSDFKQAPPKVKRLDIDPWSILGGAPGIGWPVFRLEKDYRGLHKGQLGFLGTIPLPVPEGTRPTPEATKAALLELIENGVLKRVGVIGEDAGEIIVQPADDLPADYIGREPFMTAAILRHQMQ